MATGIGVSLPAAGCFIDPDLYVIVVARVRRCDVFNKAKADGQVICMRLAMEDEGLADPTDDSNAQPIDMNDAKTRIRPSQG